MTRYVFSGLSKFALLEKAWKYRVMMFFSYDLVGLVLHQTQIFGSRDLAATVHFSALGKRFADSLPRS